MNADGPNRDADELLLDPATQDVADEERDTVTRIAAELGDMDALSRRRAACRDALALAQDAPIAGRLLAPILTDVLLEEVARSYADAATELFMRQYSEEIRRYAARALAVLAGGRLVEGYDASDWEIRQVVRGLSATLTNCRAKRTRLTCVDALAAISRSRPVTVATNTAVDLVAADVGRLLDGEAADFQGPAWRPFGRVDRRRDLARLLAVLQANSSVDVSRIESVGAALPALESSEDLHCRLFAGIVTTDLWAEDGRIMISTVTDEISRLLDDLDTTKHERRRLAATVIAMCADGPDRRRVWEAICSKVHDIRSLQGRLWTAVLGEFVAARPDHANSAASTLIAAVHTSSGRDRQRIARALGLRAFVEHTMDADPIRYLGDCVLDTMSSDGMTATVLGEIIAHDPSEIDIDIGPLVDEARSSTDWDRGSAVRAIGSLAAISLGNNEEAVREYLEAADPHSTLGQAVITGLGELTAMQPDIHELVPGELAEKIPSMSGKERLDATRSIGIIAASALECDTDALGPIIDRCYGGYHINRELVLWAVGETVANAEEQVTEVPSTLVDEVRGGSGKERRRAATAVGLITEASRNSHADIVEYLVDEDYPLDIELRMRAIGEVTANARDEHEHTALVDEVRSATGRDRRRTAESLGLLVVAGRQKDRDATQYLVDAFEEVKLEGRQEGDEFYDPLFASYGEYRGSIARAIGELLAGEPSEHPFILESLVDTLRSSTGGCRRRASRAVGLLGIAHFTNDGALYDAVVDEMNDIAVPWEYWWNPTALGTLAEHSPAAARALRDRLTEEVVAGTGRYHLTATRPLGEVVLARPNEDEQPLCDLLEESSFTTAAERGWAMAALGLLAGVDEPWGRLEGLVLVLHWSTYHGSESVISEVIESAVCCGIISQTRLLKTVVSDIESSLWCGTGNRSPGSSIEAIPWREFWDVTGPVFSVIDDEAQLEIFRLLSDIAVRGGDDKSLHSVRETFEEFLTVNDQAPAATRLKIINLLISIPEIDGPLPAPE